jgi:hypothetical protein
MMQKKLGQGQKLVLLQLQQLVLMLGGPIDTIIGGSLRMLRAYFVAREIKNKWCRI